MWPILLDMTEEESIQNLRHLELEAYSSLVSALRAQGNLNQEKRRLLKETSVALNISNDRHKAEIRRAISDERLNTIAYHITGQLSSLEDWAQEGRRLVPLLPRVPPQTPYSIIADDASEAAVQYNKQLPLPAHTERKRSAASLSPSVSSNEPGVKSQPFRVPEVPKDDFKKRKGHIGENSSLAQHLLGPKLSRIQQIYRQTSKVPKQKHKDSDETEHQEAIKTVAPPGGKLQTTLVPSNNVSQKINIIQNISISPLSSDPLLSDNTSDSVMVNENQAPPGKNLGLRQSSSSSNDLTPPGKSLGLRQASSSSNDLTPSGKSISLRQSLNASNELNTPKTINKGQKLIVVSNSQTITSNSILQKTLSVPINKLTKLNLDKFKIVGTSSQFPTTLQANTQTISPKLVTLKGTAGKKVIPLSQLQMLNSKSLKVVPFSGKVTMKKAIITMNSNVGEELTQTTTVCDETVPVDKGNIEDEDSSLSTANVNVQLEELADCNNSRLVELDNNDSNSESNEITDTDEECNIVNEMEVDSYSVIESNERETDDLLEECELFQDGELF